MADIWLANCNTPSTMSGWLAGWVVMWMGILVVISTVGWEVLATPAGMGGWGRIVSQSLSSSPAPLLLLHGVACWLLVQVGGWMA